NAMRGGSSKGGVLDDPRRSSRDLRGEGRGLGPGRLLYLRESIGAVLALPLPALPAPVNHRVPRAPRTVDEVVFHGSPPGPRPASFGDCHYPSPWDCKSRARRPRGGTASQQACNKDSCARRHASWARRRVEWCRKPLPSHRLACAMLESMERTTAAARQRRATRRRPMIRKLPTGEYRLYSRKIDPKTGRRRNLGTFKTREEAERHERAVQFFSRRG